MIQGILEGCLDEPRGSGVARVGRSSRARNDDSYMGSRTLAGGQGDQLCRIPRGRVLCHLLKEQ